MLGWKGSIATSLGKTASGTTEEDVLACYLQSGRRFVHTLDLLLVSGDIWELLVQEKPYKAKQCADKEIPPAAARSQVSEYLTHWTITCTSTAILQRLSLTAEGKHARNASHLGAHDACVACFEGDILGDDW